MESSGGHRPGRRLWTGIPAALVALALGPSAASAVTIDFEDRDPGETVNDQYSSQGVTFNDPVAFDYGPGFAHSGTKAIELCRGNEACTFADPPPRIRADFTVGQTTVGVWVGVTSNATANRSIRLTAFNGSGAEVGHQDVTLPPGSPATNHLTVTAGSAIIRSFEVAATDTGGIFDIVVDDVEFSAAGPPPPCSASGPPTITLTSPTDNTYVQNNQILLKGFVNNGGAPIRRARVVSEGATTRTAIAYPTPIDADGGSFAINLNGLLQQGDQKVHVRASNCAGTGVSANPIVTYSPLPPTAGFQQLAPVEVVQTVQSSYNPVPLIAGNANGTKRTFARVHLSAEGVSVPITNVSGRLTATRLDGSPPGGPLTVDSLNTITVQNGQTLAGARASLNNGLYFELPSEWLTEGRLHLQLEQLRIEGAQTTLPCVYCDNYGGISATVTFHRVPPARIWLVGVPYTTTIGGTTQTFMPRQKDFDFLVSWLRRAYPASEVQITQAALPGVNDQPGYEDDPDTPADESREGFLCDDVKSRLGQFVGTIPTQPVQTRYYGVVSDANGALFMRGCSDIGGRFGSGPAGCCSFGWDTDTVYTDWYGGHEIAHMYDRRHPDGGCGDSDDDGGFPFVGGNIGDSVYTNQGVDVGDASLSPMQPVALYDWPRWHDVMTYCDDQWLSSYTYNGILRNLCADDLPNCPDSADLTKAAAKRGGQRVAVQGEIDLARDRVRLAPMSALAGLTLTERSRKGPYAIVMRGADGKRLKSFPFKPHEISDLPAGERRASIDAVVPFPKATERIEIARGGKVLAARAVSEHAPVVELRALKGRRLDEPVKLRWRARDADGDRVLSTVHYAPDGKRFTPIAAGLRKRSLKVDPDALPGGERARFRVVGTDGVLTGIDRSKRVSVAAKAPRISIATPVDGAQLIESQSVQLVASVTDDQDPRLGDQVVWSSDVQGELSRGGMITARLQPGTHQLTASVTNSLGLASAASIRVEVEAIPPTLDAQLIP